jgi:hypothetical protein
MKHLLFRWLPGLAIVSGISSATVATITSPMRHSIADLENEAAELSLRETETLQDLEQMRLAKAGAIALPPDALWSKGQSASAAIALQEALVSTANAAGLQLVSFGETTPPAAITHPTLASELELNGTHEELSAFLASLETTSPALAVSYLWLRHLPPDPTQPGSPISIRMTVWGFLAAEDAQ